MNKGHLILSLILLVLAGATSFVVAKSVPSESLGALSSPRIPSPYLTWGGVATYQARIALNTATTTPCAILSPVSTSTLEFADLIIKTPTSTATTWTLAKATTRYATTTKLSVFSLGSGVTGTMVGTTTASNITGSTVAVDDLNVIAPSTYIVWGVAGIDKIADTSKLNGYCQAGFRSIGA